MFTPSSGIYHPDLTNPTLPSFEGTNDLPQSDYVSPVGVVYDLPYIIAGLEQQNMFNGKDWIGEGEQVSR